MWKPIIRTGTNPPNRPSSETAHPSRRRPGTSTRPQKPPSSTPCSSPPPTSSSTSTQTGVRPAAPLLPSSPSWRTNTPFRVISPSPRSTSTTSRTSRAATASPPCLPSCSSRVGSPPPWRSDSPDLVPRWYLRMGVRSIGSGVLTRRR